jgi:hypothetical protein
MSKYVGPLWAAAVNLRGLWSDKPVKVLYDKSDGTWWDESGNLEIRLVGSSLGLYHQVFSSKSKREVQIWIDGYKACARAVYRLTTFVEEPKG